MAVREGLLYEVFVLPRAILAWVGAEERSDKAQHQTEVGNIARFESVCWDSQAHRQPTSVHVEFLGLKRKSPAYFYAGLQNSMAVREGLLRPFGAAVASSGVLPLRGDRTLSRVLTLPHRAETKKPRSLNQGFFVLN